MSRKPPIAVIRELRKEVGFGCPVPGCGNPYLEWHHFDPPYAVEQHHRPEGMIALCINHHKKADSGAYTKEQLRNFKRVKASPDEIKGRFDWLRNKLLVVAGGNYYYDIPTPLVIDNHNVISFNRDEDGYALLNVKMLSLSKEERIILTNNNWENIGAPSDLVSPPSGKLLNIHYENGDLLTVEFNEIISSEHFESKHGHTLRNLDYPITTVEINFKLEGSGLYLTPKETNIQSSTLTRNFMRGGRIGILVETGIKWRQNWASTPKAETRNTKCPCGSRIRYKHCHGLIE